MAGGSSLPLLALGWTARSLRRLQEGARTSSWGLGLVLLPWVAGHRRSLGLVLGGVWAVGFAPTGRPVLVAYRGGVPAGGLFGSMVTLGRDLGGGESLTSALGPLTATLSGAANLVEGVIFPPSLLSGELSE